MTKPNFWERLPFSPKLWLLFYLLMALGVSLQLYYLRGNTILHDIESTPYNNYLIFKQSFWHLLAHKDLYDWYPTETADLFKYSPFFALLMAPWAFLPTPIGLALWNMVNVGIFFWGIRQIRLPKGSAHFFMAFVFMELVSSTQNSQTNALIAGLLLAGLALLRREQIFWALGALWLTVYIKLFGIVALMLFFSTPKKGKFIAYSVFWVLFYSLSPALYTGIDELWWQYQNWGRMLAEDHGISYGFSLMGILHSWFGFGDEIKKPVLLVGVLLMLLPLLRWKSFYQPRFAPLLLAAIMIWVIIFNHRAESATFIIAISAAALWYLRSALPKKFRLSLLLFCFIFSSLSPTDIFPAFIRNQFIIPYCIKALGFVVLYFVLLYELLFLLPQKQAAN